ncbi:hypothetical protein K1719_038978 [Acacia pycnantha]|nr:hypothetical protein K1719_038978 [Acacia pycnantha]
MAKQANHPTLKELATPDMGNQNLCIQYPELAVNFEPKYGLIHLLSKFHGLADLLPFDPEIERTILTARRVVRLTHRINTELDTELESDFRHSDCDHSVDLSDCVSDSISDSLVVFTDSSSNFANSDIMAEEQ